MFESEQLLIKADLKLRAKPAEIDAFIFNCEAYVDDQGGVLHIGDVVECLTCEHNDASYAYDTGVCPCESGTGDDVDWTILLTQAPTVVSKDDDHVEIEWSFHSRYDLSRLFERLAERTGIEVEYLSWLPFTDGTWTDYGHYCGDCGLIPVD